MWKRRDVTAAVAAPITVRVPVVFRECPIMKHGMAKTNKQTRQYGIFSHMRNGYLNLAFTAFTYLLWLNVLTFPFHQGTYDDTFHHPGNKPGPGLSDLVWIYSGFINLGFVHLTLAAYLNRAKESWEKLKTTQCERVFHPNYIWYTITANKK